MNEVLFVIRQCECGAVTIMSDTGQISMSAEAFEKEFPGLGVTAHMNTWANCNLCINFWSTGMCNCGSGESVGECDCGSAEPYYTLEPVKSFVLDWIKNNM